MKNVNEIQCAIERVATSKAMQETLNRTILGGQHGLNEYMQPIRGMGDDYTTYEMQGRKKQLLVIAEVYALWAALELTDDQKSFDALRGQAITLRNAKFRDDVQSTAIVLRYAFGEITDPQVSKIGRVMRYCLDKGVTYERFVSFVDSNGGLEGVRKLAVKAGQKAAEAEAKEALLTETVLSVIDRTLAEKCAESLKTEDTVDELDSTKWLETETFKVYIGVRDGNSETAELKDVYLDEETTEQVLKLYAKQVRKTVTVTLMKLEKQISDLEYDKQIAKSAMRDAQRAGDMVTYRALQDELAKLAGKAVDAQIELKQAKKEATA